MHFATQRKARGARLIRRLAWATAALAVVAAAEPAVAAAKAGSVRSARIWPAQDYTRVAFESASPFKFELQTVKDPERLVLDLEDVEPGAALTDLVGRIAPDDPYVKQVRIGRFKPGTLRIVFDLKVEVTANAFALDPVAGYGHRLVLDIYPTKVADPLLALIERGEAKTLPGETAALAAADAASSPAATLGNSNSMPVPAASAPQIGLAGPPRAPSEPARGPAPSGSSGNRIVGTAQAADSDAAPAGHGPTTVAPVLPPPAQAVHATPAAADTAKASSADDARAPQIVDRLTTVAIDAGHGGEDPGAHGRSALEKDVTLAIARRLKQKIDAVPNMRAVLVRDGDYFIPLAGRTEKARRLHADVFVSVHADSFISPDARGSSVFALSERGASSAAARWLAKRENESDLVGGVKLQDKDPYLARTLLDLSQTATINDSLKLGRAVLNELGGLNSLHRGEVEQAGFAVLKSPDIPSILVETAFISNPAEEKRLSDASYQDKMANAIVAGLKRYLARNPISAKARAAKGT